MGPTLRDLNFENSSSWTTRISCLHQHLTSERAQKEKSLSTPPTQHRQLENNCNVNRLYKPITKSRRNIK